MAPDEEIRKTPDTKKERDEFLLHMYDQMFNDINRHIIVIWQSVGVLVGSFAVLALSEKGVIPVDLGYALIILISAWLIGLAYDSSYWYNRNLAIIANIEKQFLEKEDQRDIHYYFGKHRKPGAMLHHLRLQYLLGFGIALLVIGHHFWTRVKPGFGAPWRNFDFSRALPYLVFAAGLIVLCWFRSKRKKNYEEFLRESPGIEVDTSEVCYGSGHPTVRRKNTK